MCVLLQADNNDGGAGKGDFGPARRKGSTVQGSLVLPGCNGMSKSSHRNAGYYVHQACTCVKYFSTPNFTCLEQYGQPSPSHSSL